MSMIQLTNLIRLSAYAF